MTRAAAKRVTITPRTDNGALDGRYPTGVPPAPPDITVSQSIPNISSIPSGTPFSQNFSSYATGTGLAGAIYSIEAVSGTLATLGLSASGAVISGNSPIASTSASVRLRLDKSGFTFRSNAFSLSVSASAPPDTLPPTIAPPPEISVVSSTALTVVQPWSMDPQTPTIVASGMKSRQWQRSVSGGNFANLGSLVLAPSLGEILNFSAGTIGAPGAGNSVSQNGPDFNFSNTTGAIGVNTAGDVLTVAATQELDFFDFFAYVPSWTNTDANPWDECGLMVRQDLTPTSAMFAVQCFIPAGGHGVSSSWRSAGGSVRTGNASVTAGVPSNAWIRLIRLTGSNTITSYYYNINTGLWTQLYQATLSLSGPVYLMAYACRNTTGASASPQVTRVGVNKLGNVTLNDTGLSTNTAYQYRAVDRDVFGNSITSDTSLAVSTSIAPGTGIKSHFGLWQEDSTHVRGYGAGLVKGSDDIGTIVTEPAYVVGLLQGVDWGHIEAPGGGSYYFNYLDSLYTACANAGKYFAINLWPAAIGGNNSFPAASLPTYLQGATYDPLGVGYIGTPSGPFAKVWLKNVMDRYIALIQAIGAHYNGLPFFEGIMLPETAWAMTSPADASFTQDALVNQFLRMIPAARAAFPSCLCCARFNYSTNAQLISLTQAALANQLGTGTTDCYTQQTPEEAVMNGSTGGVDYRNQIPPTPCSEYAPFGPNTTSDQIIGYAKNTLLARYLFVLRYTGDGWNVATWANMKATYVSNYGSSMVTTKPTSYP